MMAASIDGGIEPSASTSKIGDSTPGAADLLEGGPRPSSKYGDVDLSRLAILRFQTPVASAEDLLEDVIAVLGVACLECVQFRTPVLYVLAVSSSTMVEELVAKGLVHAGRPVDISHADRPAKVVILRDVPWPLSGDQVLAEMSAYGRIRSLTRANSYTKRPTVNTGLWRCVMEMSTPVPNIMTWGPFTVSAVWPGMTKLCFRCRRPGHTAASCSSASPCANCQRLGHWAARCDAPCTWCSTGDHPCPQRTFSNVVASGSSSAPASGDVMEALPSSPVKDMVVDLCSSGSSDGGMAAGTSLLSDPGPSGHQQRKQMSTEESAQVPLEQAVEKEGRSVAHSASGPSVSRRSDSSQSQSSGTSVSESSLPKGATDGKQKRPLDSPGKSPRRETRSAAQRRRREEQGQSLKTALEGEAGKGPDWALQVDLAEWERLKVKTEGIGVEAEECPPASYFEHRRKELEERWRAVTIRCGYRPRITLVGEAQEQLAASTILQHVDLPRWACVDEVTYAIATRWTSHPLFSTDIEKRVLLAKLRNEESRNWAIVDFDGM